MKRLFLYLFLILFTLQTPSQADDIRDFQIEGMSLGDSLLDYMTKNEIDKLNHHYYSKKMYAYIYFDPENLKIYEALQITWKTDDQNYKIQQLSGGIFYTNKIKDCYKKQNEIISDLEDIFGKSVKKKSYTKKHSADKTGNSLNKTTQFEFKTKDVVRVSCYDWSKKITKEKNWHDNLRVVILDGDFRNWINTNAYK